MAYSTRRKSVNLSLLGIHIPGPRPVPRSPPTTCTSSNSASEDSSSASPPTKKIKRSHSNPSSPESLSPISAKFSAVPSPTHSIRRPSFTVHTPPPSPPATSGEDELDADPPAPTYPKVDTEGINDEVVVATIHELEKEDNRPLLLKELAQKIAGHVHVVETSANQSAIISSRLTNFLKRPWTALAPCPLAKELVGTHPKRLFFFLSSRPRQAIPDPDAPQNKVSRIVTPSLTSATDEEDHLSRRRTEMSPSPELELIPPELEDVESHLSRSSSFSMSSSVGSLSQIKTTPQLERDEHEFTQTANSLQLKRKQPSSQDVKMENSISFETSHLFEGLEYGVTHRRDSTGSTSGDGFLSVRKTGFLLSSPVIHPQSEVDGIPSKPTSALFPLPLAEYRLESSFVWTELKSPETLELDELETLFESY